jgi:transposase
VTPLADDAAAAFVPVQILEARSDAVASPAAAQPNPECDDRKSCRRGAMEISLPNGARVSLDADVEARELRRVLSALGDL